MKILHIIPNFYPATKWGGPIFSTKAICDEVVGFEGVDVKVLTTDAAGPDLSDKIPLLSRNVTTPEGYTVTYFKRVLGNSISPGLLYAMPDAIRAADVIHLTSAYSAPVLPALVFANLIGRPVIWSPRGAMQAADQWADAPRKKVKRVFESIARQVAPTHTVLHVTAAAEAEATQRRMPGIRCKIIPNSVVMPPLDVANKREWRPGGRLRVIFLGRLHPKKGIDVLIDSLSRIPKYVELEIFGTGDKEYLSELKRAVSDLGLIDRVRFSGHVDGEDKTTAFSNADLFVLPSHSENFGIVVAEALAHGVPVITTDTTPWGRVVEKRCGECIPLNVDALASAIERLAQMDLKEMGLRGREWIEEEFSQKKTGAAMYQLYLELIAAQRRGQKVSTS